MIEPVLQWFGARAATWSPPVLEVGSFNVNGSVRSMFAEPYIGLDMRDGPGVDVVGDVLTHHFGDGEFNTIVSTETLEHCAQPWKAIERMSYWLAPGGKMLISVPFRFDFHEYPSDYWRMTHEGLKLLFEAAGLTTLEAEIIDTHTYGMAQK
jgi:SAM-dependent methyltransferase